MSPTPAAVVSANVEDQQHNVPVSTTLELTVTDGTFVDVEIAYKDEGERTTLPGHSRGGDTVWSADDRLEPGTRYALRATAQNADGQIVEFEHVIWTEALSDDQEIFPSIAPLDGEEVGVGMPVVVLFDAPVSDRESFQEHLRIVTDGEIEGTWGWISDTEVHYRPRQYWPAGTAVTVVADLNGVPAGDGRYGKLDRKISFTVGDRVVSTVNVKSHRMAVNINGEVVRKFPITTGKPGYESRNGTKVVMEKHPTKVMDSSTTRDAGSDYRVKVSWALRLTLSGEFIHAAPWSTGQQGSANVSHGCVGMTEAAAKWFYEHSNRGDVVKFINSSRELEPQNGWTDWDVSFEEFTKRSAL